MARQPFPGAELGPCDVASRRRELSAEEVESLPRFNLTDLQNRIEQTLGVPMRWSPHDAEHTRVLGAYDEETQLRTADGAMEATLIGQVAKFSEDNDRPAELHSDAFHSHSYVDLRKVFGTLRFELDAPHPARLLLQIDYRANGTDGYVAPEIILSPVGAGTFDTPLKGGWGRFF